MCPPVLSNLVRKRSSSYNFRYTNILQVPTVKITLFGKRSFKYAAPVLRNSLPDDFRQCSNFNQFKGLILSCNGKNCNCVTCNSNCVSVAQVRLFFSGCIVLTFNYSVFYISFSLLLFC